MDDIRIVPASDTLIESFHATLDVVSRERIYLALTEAPSIEVVREFVNRLLADGGVQYFALSSSNQVVGWCDIARGRVEGSRHVGTLGMGLLPDYRDRGVGRRLAQAAIATALAGGIERIELEVYAQNTRAIALYQRLGFVTEGTRRRARKLDGEYSDSLVMALLRPEVASGPP